MQKRLLVYPDTSTESSQNNLWEFDTVDNCTSATVPFGAYNASLTTIYPDMVIDWGDGTVTTSISANSDYTHTYAEAGKYHVTIYHPDWESVTVPRSSSAYIITYPMAARTSFSKVYKIPKVGNTNLNALFAHWTTLEEVPENLFDNNTDITNLSYIFYYCTSLKTIPKNLFSKLTALVNLSYGFSNSGLEEIPEGLLDNCPNLSNINYLLSDTIITSIPEDLFVNQVALTSFSYVFYRCANLVSIPERLFRNNINVTTFSYTFSDCTSLTEIPTYLFSYNTAVTSFSYTFRNCTNISQIPSILFSNNTEVTTFTYTFYQCTELTSIPENLFANNPLVTDFSYVFSYCSKIAEIPEGLFEYNTEVTTFRFAFYGCNSNLVVSRDIFANQTKVSNLGAVFGNSVVANNTVCPNSNYRYVSFVINSEVISTFYYNQMPFAQNTDDIYLEGIVEGSTTATAINSYNNFSYRVSELIPLDMTTSPCVEVWEFDTIENCTTVGVPISTDTLYEGMTIDWGDGQTTTVTSDMLISEAYTHTYTTAWQYHVSVYYDDWENVTLSYTGDTTASSPIREARNSIAKVYAIPKVANTTFTRLFAYYTALTEVTADLLVNDTNILSFTYLFRNCTSLTEIPSGLFDNQAHATNFFYAFCNCTGLTSIPDGLFGDCTAVTNFEYCFYGCSNLVTIPEDLFSNNTLVTSFAYTFYGCSSLTTIPENLFQYNTSVTAFNYCFSNCTGLTKIPSGLFANNTAVTNFNNVFRACTNLTEIPSDLLANNTAVTRLNYALFNTNQPHATNKSCSASSIDYFGLTIGSSNVSSANYFTSSTTGIIIECPSGSTTESTFSSADYYVNVTPCEDHVIYDSSSYTSLSQEHFLSEIPDYSSVVENGSGMVYLEFTLADLGYPSGTYALRLSIDLDPSGSIIEAGIKQYDYYVDYSNMCIWVRDTDILYFYLDADNYIDAAEIICYCG